MQFILVETFFFQKALNVFWPMDLGSKVVENYDKRFNWIKWVVSDGHAHSHVFFVACGLKIFFRVEKVVALASPNTIWQRCFPRLVLFQVSDTPIYNNRFFWILNTIQQIVLILHLNILIVSEESDCFFCPFTGFNGLLLSSYVCVFAQRLIYQNGCRI